MAEILSLKAARKAKARADKEKAAAENRARFGRSKADRALDEAKSAQAAAKLDGHKRGDDEAK